jgi:hypothetical protein
MKSEETAASELESWRQVHGSLIEAVKVAEEAVAAQKAQRRYWLEEICANLDEEGMHQPTSVWKRPQVTIKKQLPKRISSKPPAVKRKKSIEPKPGKKARKRKSEDGGLGEETSRATSKPKKSTSAAKAKKAVPTPEPSPAEIDEEQEMRENDQHQRVSNAAAAPTLQDYGSQSDQAHSAYHHHHHHHHHPPHVAQQPAHWGPGAQNNNLQMMVCYGV